MPPIAAALVAAATLKLVAVLIAADTTVRACDREVELWLGFYNNRILLLLGV